MSEFIEKSGTKKTNTRGSCLSRYSEVLVRKAMVNPPSLRGSVSLPGYKCYGNWLQANPSPRPLVAGQAPRQARGEGGNLPKTGILSTLSGH